VVLGGIVEVVVAVVVVVVVASVVVTRAAVVVLASTAVAVGARVDVVGSPAPVSSELLSLNAVPPHDERSRGRTATIGSRFIMGVSRYQADGLESPPQFLRHAPPHASPAHGRRRRPERLVPRKLCLVQGVRHEGEADRRRRADGGKDRPWMAAPALGVLVVIGKGEPTRISTP